ncbi:MAG: hypothetical protein GY705_10625 [Bacteroidetes bacterium]|nr:hypothetical protein [Bacteroidota bacterium]
MNRHELEYPITSEDLKFIVEEEYDEIVNLAKTNSFCRNCRGNAKVEMINYSLTLNDLNDVIFQGECKSCGGNIARYIEIGEQNKYRERTETIKKKAKKGNK